MDKNGVNIIVKNDDSVDKQLQKTAKMLHKKYTKKRKINEKLLRKKSPIEMIFSGIFDVICVVLIVLSLYMCYSNISARIQKTNPSIAGYTNMRIATGSMVKSGHKPGDVIMVRAVDTDTLKVGDKIAYYVSSINTAKFLSSKHTIVDKSSISETAYKTDINTLLSIPSAEIKKEAAKNSKQVFHHIIEIYEDSKGQRWFKTQGSSNPYPDSWYICETTVIGLYDDSATAKTLTSLLTSLSTTTGLIMWVAIPLILIVIMVLPSCLKDVQRAMLELDVVEEKRKLTDDICVRNDVGYEMDNETKFKVLACAPDDQKMTYISLLWREGTAPNSIKKFYLRKEINLSSIEKLRDINRECEKMFKDNVSMTKIAKFYRDERAKVEKEQEAYKKTLKALKIKYEGEKEIQ